MYLSSEEIRRRLTRKYYLATTTTVAHLPIWLDTARRHCLVLVVALQKISLMARTWPHEYASNIIILIIFCFRLQCVKSHKMVSECIFAALHQNIPYVQKERKKTQLLGDAMV